MPFALNAQGLRAISGVMFETAKSQLPDSVLAAKDEKLNFAKFGKKKGDGMEMTNVPQDAQGVGAGAVGGEMGPDGQMVPGEGGEINPSAMPDAHAMAAKKLQRDMSMGSSSLAEAAEGPTDLITEWQAGWNVTNAIQGMFIVSLPYAVLHGGYWAIVAMVGIAYICCYTGKILVECLYDLDENGQLQRVRHSYKGIAKEVFGQKYGGLVVNIAQLIELLMTCILYVVLCGDLMIGSFPDGAIDARSWMMICGIILIPCAFLNNLHHVSTLSFWCMVTHLIINFIIFAYCLGSAPTWAWSKVRFRIDVLQFPIALGIIVFSYTSHIFLPTLEYNMVDRSKFTFMLDWSHIAAAVFKSLFGYMGYLTWADDTEEVITNNLPNPGFKGFVNIILVIKALLSYPLPYYAACELIEHSLFRGPPKTLGPSIWALDGELKVWGLGFRVFVVFFTILMAVFIPHFAILMGLIGSFTGTMLSFIWPSYFHIKIKGQYLTWRELAYDWFVIGLGCLFGVIGVSTSFYALVNAFQIGLPF